MLLDQNALVFSESFSRVVSNFSRKFRKLFPDILSEGIWLLTAKLKTQIFRTTHNFCSSKGGLGQNAYKNESGFCQHDVMVLFLFFG